MSVLRVDEIRDRAGTGLPKFTHAGNNKVLTTDGSGETVAVNRTNFAETLSLSTTQTSVAAGSSEIGAPAIDLSANRSFLLTMGAVSGATGHFQITNLSSLPVGTFVWLRASFGNTADEMSIRVASGNFYGNFTFISVFPVKGIISRYLTFLVTMDDATKRLAPLNL